MVTQNKSPPTSESVLASVGKVMVKSIANRNDGAGNAVPAQHALFDIAMAHRGDWTVQQADALAGTLDKCRLKVADWLLLQ